MIVGPSISTHMSDVSAVTLLTIGCQSSMLTVLGLQSWKPTYLFLRLQ
jgi:hypothetical protein